MENAYAAGFFDGEGSVSVVRHNKYQHRIIVVVAISQVDARPLHMLHTKYGGSLMLLKNSPAREGGNAQKIWRWQVTNRQVTLFLQDILPYLIVKKAEAELALMAVSLSRNRSGKKSSNHLTDQEKQDRDCLMFNYKVLRGGLS